MSKSELLSLPVMTRTQRDLQSSTEDLFLDLANDEPSDVSEQEHGRLQSITIKANSTTPTVTGRSTSQHTHTGASSSSTAVATDSNTRTFRTDRYSSRARLSPALSKSFTDTSSDRASIASIDNQSPVQRPVTGRQSKLANQPLSHQVSTSFREATENQKAHRSTRRPSNLSHELPNPYQLDYTAQPVEPPTLSPLPPSNADTAESVGSTTAASTVWDELEELKQRIRRLEFSGHRPKPGATTNDETPDRPHTANTMTTASSVSNTGRRTISSPTYPSPSDPPPSYPLLRAALQKAKNSVYPEIYQALESSASDALEIADVVPMSISQTLSTEQGPSLSDLTTLRRLRRKSESICRSLTELCIALCEDSNRQALRQSAWDDFDSPLSPSFAADDASPSNYLSERQARLDRASLMSHRPISRSSQYAASSVLVDDVSSDRKAVFSRPSQRRRSNGPEDQTSFNPTAEPRSYSRATTSISRDDSEDRDPTIRAPSRAMTEVNYTRHSSMRDHFRDAQKFSREYTARHPLPDKSLSSFQHHSGGNYSLKTAKQHPTNDPSPVTDLPPRNSSRASSRGHSISSTLADRLEARRHLQQQQQQQQQQAVASMPATSSSSSSAAYLAARTRSFSRTNRPPSSMRVSRYDRDAIGT